MDKIDDFLRELELQNSARRTWGIGTVISRSSAKGAQALLGVKVRSEEDHLLIPENSEIVVQKAADAISRICNGLKDPALFDFPTATFCVYLVTQMLGSASGHALVFVTVKPLSEKSTHVIIVAFARQAFTSTIAAGRVKEVRNAIKEKFE